MFISVGGRAQAHVGLCTGLRGRPEEDGIDGTDHQLEPREREREICPSGRLRAQLVVDVVVVVAEVPQSQVDDEPDVHVEGFDGDSKGGAPDESPTEITGGARRGPLILILFAVV